jgi:hypothetical protein
VRWARGGRRGRAGPGSAGGRAGRWVPDSTFLPRPPRAPRSPRARSRANGRLHWAPQPGPRAPHHEGQGIRRLGLHARVEHILHLRGGGGGASGSVPRPVCGGRAAARPQRSPSSGARACRCTPGWSRTPWLRCQAALGTRVGPGAGLARVGGRGALRGERRSGVWGCLRVSGRRHRTLTERGRGAGRQRAAALAAHQRGGGARPATCRRPLRQRAAAPKRACVDP